MTDTQSLGTRLRRRLLHVGAGVVAVATTAATASAQDGHDMDGGMMGGEMDVGAQFVEAVTSTTHILGIVASVLLAYHAYRARKQFAGGVIGESATYAMVGAAAFTLAFLNMELSNGFGVELFGFLGMQLRMAVNMGLFTTTVFAFGYAFYRTASVLGGDV